MVSVWQCYGQYCLSQFDWHDVVIALRCLTGVARSSVQTGKVFVLHEQRHFYLDLRHLHARPIRGGLFSAASPVGRLSAVARQVLRRRGPARRRRQEPPRGVDSRSGVPDADRRKRDDDDAAGAASGLRPADRRVPQLRDLRATVDSFRRHQRRPVLRHRLLQRVHRSRAHQVHDRQATGFKKKTFQT